MNPTLSHVSSILQRAELIMKEEALYKRSNLPDYMQKLDTPDARDKDSETSEKLLLENQLLSKRIFSEFALPVPNYTKGFPSSIGLNGLVAAIDTINTVY